MFFYSPKIFLIMVGVILLTGGIAFYFYRQSQRTLLMLSDPKVASAEERKSLTAKVGKLMELPSDEEPSVVTVLDKEKLKDQPFFTRAENGDKVLVFSSAKQAVLYRPRSNKIVQVGPIDVSASTGGTEAGDSTGEKKIVIYYSDLTKSAFLDKIEDNVKASVDNSKVLRREKIQSEYAQTLVIDLNSSQKDAAEKIARALDGSVSSLPDGEQKPSDADILIIIGKVD